MRTAQDEFLTLRLPRDLRAALAGRAQATGATVSVITRNALALGLAAISSAGGPDDPPPPAAPSAALRVAA